MKALLALVPVTLFALANCGTGDTSPASSAGDDPATTAGSGPAKSCRATCNTAADCATPNQPLQDAAHFSCVQNRCEWLGCQSPDECKSALQSAKVTCGTLPGADVSTCVPACQTAADCVIQGTSLGDANHFACNGGKCEWQGCKSTDECKTATQSNRVVCEKPEGAAAPTCVPICTKAADCATPGAKLTDADHYTCTAGRCKWLGCKSTAECTADLHISNVICE